MKSAEIRKAFLDYFEQREHRVVPSSPLVPANDPTLLFTNAGMVQFKDVFTGREQRDYQRATSSQRCVRAGGKHNDLENVGYTARHHTFFEMLGNFSFGDYFKSDAIAFCWDFLTRELGLPAERLWVTVHDSDDEAERIWIEEVGVPADRVTRLGDDDNFWAMGDTGPCGPCSEIFYDHGAEVAGGPPGSPDADGDRYVEIWNLVFMQFERAADGSMTELPRPSVDTGMGLERVAAVLQGVHNNYDIDLFVALIDAVKAATGVAQPDAQQLPSCRVIADHIRSAAFLITDGVLPGNEGRGYVLRRIIRRALRHGHKLGAVDGFFHTLVPALVEQMGVAFPELARSAAHVERVLAQEEEQFARTLSTGMEVFETEVARLQSSEIPGEVVFRLYDTFGFPVDLTADVARERGLTIDSAGFEREMAGQRQRARAASRFGGDGDDALNLEGSSEFTGYQQLEHAARITGLLRVDDGQRPAAVDRLQTGERGIVLLERTPFYAESGGQVGDAGQLVGPGVCFAVNDTSADGAQHLHHGSVESGSLEVGATIDARVDHERRRCTARNHSATHLLHAALREVLGDHVEQKGSLVTPERLRFDFAHYQAVTADELQRIQARVNEQIWANTRVGTEIMDFEAARSRGAMALFGEKYGNEVRVLSMGEGDFSVELCGGTHVARTGDIGVLWITAESGIAAGVRRIEAVTGSGVTTWAGDLDGTLQRIAVGLKASRDEVERRVTQLVEQNRQMEKRVAQLEGKLASSRGSELADQAVEVGDVKVLAADLGGMEAKAMMPTLDQLKSKLGSAVIVLATVVDDRVNLIAGVTGDLTDRIKAGDLVQMVAEQVGAKGGGRPDMARAGGGDRPEALAEALASVQAWAVARIG